MPTLAYNRIRERKHLHNQHLVQIHNKRRYMRESNRRLVQIKNFRKTPHRPSLSGKRDGVFGRLGMWVLK